MTSQLPAASLSLFFVGFRPFSPALCSRCAHTPMRTCTCYDMHGLAHVAACVGFDLGSCCTLLCLGRKQLIQSDPTQPGIWCSYSLTGRSSAVGNRNLSVRSPASASVTVLRRMKKRERGKFNCPRAV